MKKKILFCNEASFMSTGFANYGFEIMKRLYKTGKYELAEFASYGGTEINNDTRYHQLPWKYYPNLPQNEEEAKRYQPQSIDQFGAWKFENVILDFKPDIVFDIRDWWMFEHQERSPLRNNYKWVIMPTVDAYPQDDQWISTYLNADAVFTYSDWGLEILNKQTNNKIKTICSAPPGIDLNAYKVPEDKKAHKQKMGMSEDIYIVGTVMRNQSRKLYPDLISSFADVLKKAPTHIAKKLYLYLHCAYPDIGWDIPRLIKEAGIANRTIFTYYCNQEEGGCGKVFPSFYQDVVGVCHNCGKQKAIMPRTQLGISREELGKIIGLFDVYVQYSTCEGFGIPQIEAAGCGVPVFAVDYSAMSDVVRKIKGFPIKVQRLYREAETHCYRALPDNNDLVENLIDFFNAPEQQRKYWSNQTRQAVEIHYNWDKTAKLWENLFDKIDCLPQEQTWFSPAKIHYPSEVIPNGLSNEEFIRWGLTNIAGRPDLTNSYVCLRMIRDLNWGTYQEGMGGKYLNEASTLGSRNSNKKFGREEALQILLQMSKERNFWEIQKANFGGKK